MSKVGFVTMGESAGGDDIPTVGVGMLGYGFMGKAHSNAYKTLAYMTWPPPLMPQLVAIAGRNEEAVAGAARRYGFAEHVTDWQRLVSDDRIGVFDNSGPNNFHAEPTIAAAEAGKHVLCEKPLGRDADEAYETWQRVAATGVKAMCAFNYRFVPGRAAGARRSSRPATSARSSTSAGATCRSGSSTPTSRWSGGSTSTSPGSGALGDLGAHVIDLARYLVGEIASVSASTRTFVKDRDGGTVDVDDAVESVVDFADGAVGTIEATRFASGRKNALQFEINGSKGSLAFDIERLNELQVHYAGSSPGKLVAGLPHRAGVRGRPPVLGALVAPGPHDRVGAHLRARDPPLPDARSATTPRSARTARRSRTATAPPRSATRCCARPSPAAARTSTYRS